MALSISNNCCLSRVTFFVKVGRSVMIAPNCCIVAFKHGAAANRTLMIYQPLVKAAIIIEDDVWLGANATITAGVTICSEAVIAANSEVTLDVAEFNIVGGVPARFIKHRSGYQDA